LAKAPGAIWTGEHLEEAFRLAFPKRQLFSSALTSEKVVSTEQLAAIELRLREALSLLEQGELQEDTLYASGLMVLASNLMAQARFEEAESLLRRGLTICESIGPAADFVLLPTLNLLKNALLAQGRPSEAEPFAEQAAQLATKDGSAQSPLVRPA
jgi:tetratricopeptide (TPR) repeat protein